MRIPTTEAVTTFYVALETQWHAEQQMRKLGGNVNGLGQVKKMAEQKTEEIAKPLAKAFFTYIVEAAGGEARHAHERCTHHWKGWANEFHSRTEVAEQTLKYDPKSFLQEAVKLYRDYDWSSDFGGKSWARIAEAGLMYGNIPDIVFLDHVVDLSHNNGLYLNKEIIFERPMDDYIWILNKKREGELIAVLETTYKKNWYGNLIKMNTYKREFCQDIRLLSCVEELINLAREKRLYNIQPNYNIYFGWKYADIPSFGNEKFSPEYAISGEDEDDEYFEEEDNYDTYEHIDLPPTRI